jgi:serine/threonine protein kinase
LLRISANQLAELPDWLLRMPRLAWLAFAGNPFTQALETQALINAPTPQIAWHRLQVQQRLGEGASGVIHQAVLHTEEGEQAVAVKLFNGAVTSDGLPDCEMAACMQAGAHPQLVSAMARVTEHPSHQQALVMPLIAPEFVNLAGPPSLESCTRDVYAPHKRLSGSAALRIAKSIASATQHLHACGILHGDLYAHNILHTEEGDALLSDFGAAAFFDIHDTVLASGLEKLEVRALGCLLEELAAQCEAEHASVMQLKALAHQCMNDTPAKRSGLAEVCAALEALKN